MRREIVVELNDFEILLQQCAKTIHGENGRLVRSWRSANINAEEQGGVINKNPRHFFQRDLRIRHVIESVAADNQIGAIVQQRETLGREREVDGSTAGFVVD